MHAFDVWMDTLIAALKARKPGVQQMILETFQCRKAVLELEALAGLGFLPMQISISGMEVTTYTVTSAPPLRNSTP